MSFETARKAIDYFASMIDSSEEHCISFFGGEPLLVFDLIKKCTDYAKEKIRSEKLVFNLTTNGVLVKERVIDFIAENKFQVVISLDGPRELHNANRVFPSGKGSFDKIFENIRAINEKFPEYYRSNIHFTCVLTPSTDYLSLYDFLSNNSDLFPPSKFKCGYMREGHSSYFPGCPTGRTSENNNYSKTYSMYIKALAKREEFDLSALGSLFDRKFLEIHKRPRAWLMPQSHIDPSCIPGQRRLFVAADGTFHICQQMNPTLPIGSVDAGLDFDKICEIYSSYYEKINTEACKGCWAIRFCKDCYATLAGKGVLLSPSPSKCETFRQHVVTTLVEYCSILEENPHAFDFLDSVQMSSERSLERVKKALICSYANEMCGPMRV